jgi:hypothetical protein
MLFGVSDNLHRLDDIGSPGDLDHFTVGQAANGHVGGEDHDMAAVKTDGYVTGIWHGVFRNSRGGIDSLAAVEAVIAWSPGSGHGYSRN